MSGLQSMQVGKKYLVGDSLGYDLVECLAVMPKHEMDGQTVYAVKVRYIKTDGYASFQGQCEKGSEDLFFEAEGYSSNLYVEERS